MTWLRKKRHISTFRRRKPIASCTTCCRFQTRFHDGKITKCIRLPFWTSTTKMTHFRLMIWGYQIDRFPKMFKWNHHNLKCCNTRDGYSLRQLYTKVRMKERKWNHDKKRKKLQFVSVVRAKRAPAATLAPATLACRVESEQWYFVNDCHK